MRILRYSQWNQLRANKPFKDVINENFICTDLQRAAVRRYPLGWSALPFWIAGSSTPSRGWNNPPRTKPETGPNRCARPKRRSSRSMSPNTPEMIINLITIFFNWINFKFVNFLKEFVALRAAWWLCESGKGHNFETTGSPFIGGRPFNEKTNLRHVLSPLSSQIRVQLGRWLLQSKDGWLKPATKSQ